MQYAILHTFGCQHENMVLPIGFSTKSTHTCAVNWLVFKIHKENILTINDAGYFGLKEN